MRLNVFISSDSVYRALVATVLLLVFGADTLAVSSASESTATAYPSSGQAALLQREAEVSELLSRMTLAEKVGQMTQAEFSALGDPAVIAELGLGSVLSGGNSDPGEGNSVRAWARLYNSCQSAALQTRLGVPLLYGIDAVHGHNNVTGAVIFPHNIGLGCADDEKLVERIAQITAAEVRATGIQWTFAPCVTVPRDDRWGRTYEGFSEDPGRVSRLGAAAVRGLQTRDLAAPEAVLACAKHFVGDGGTRAVIRESQFLEGVGLRLDQGNTVCDRETLTRVHIAPYLPAIAEGVATIMPSYSSWNGVKCTGSKELLTEVLKEELGFEGFLISDYNAIDQCHSDYKTAIGIAINAGIDMAMVPDRYREYIRCLTELVDEGVVPVERIDDAVRRILRVKMAMGMLDPDAQLLASDTVPDSFGSTEHRAVSRAAVGKSLVILENDGVLPLVESGRVHVAGSAADDLGVQCGGWTIDWQGAVGEVTTGGKTILQGLGEVPGVEITYSANGEGVAGADGAIVCVGEQPYAEGAGDDDQLRLSNTDRETILRCQASGVPTVVVVVSGRPLCLDESLIEASSAVVAAWLPGTEGDGVADVLFGAVSPTGTLAFTWPRSADQHPINVGDASYEPLYPFGHGLTYPARSTKPGRMADLPAQAR